MSDEQPPVIGRGGSYAKGVARRQEILDRAIAVFAERGTPGTSLRSIAQAIGVSHAALLHYFDSREQLLLAVHDHAERKRNTAPDAPTPASAVDKMVLAATANVTVPGLVELYSTLVAASLQESSEAGRAHFTARFDRVRREVADRLRDEQATGRIRRDVDPDQMAALIVAASDGLQIQWLLEPSIPLQETLGVLDTLLLPPPGTDRAADR